MKDYPNYIKGRNPFNLAGPPKHFRRALWDFDASLVVIPSITQFHYYLAQRVPKKPDLAVSVAREAMKSSPDTIQLTQHNLIPVTSILPTVNWGDPTFFQLLKQRCPDMWGGVDKYMAGVEANERKIQLAKDADIDDMLNILSKDSWKFYRKKDGLGRTWHQAALNPQFS